MAFILGLPANECLALEDSPNGVRSASSAGCVTVMVPDLTQPDEELENSEEDKPDIGSVTLHLPAFKAMAVCNQHLDHGPISIELDGSVILELADRLISDPGVHIEIGG